MNRKLLFSLTGYVGLAILIAFLPVIFPGKYPLHILIMMGINIVLSTSVRTINLTGQMSLAQGGMMTVGAYTTTLLVINLGLNSWVALITGGLLAAVVSCLIAFPFSRLKGIYFSMVTIFLAQMIITLTQELRGLTRGSQGIYNIPKPDAIGIPGLFSISITSATDFYYLILVFLALTLLILFAVERSRVGLTFRGIQLADSLSESVGIDTTLYKVAAFSLGGFFAGIIGGYYAQYVSAIAPDTFGFLYAIYTVIYMVVGGSGKFIGPIIGAIVMTVLPEIARPLQQFMPFIFAFVLIVIIFFMPEGLVGLPKKLREAGRLFTKFRKEAGTENNA
jgi:branched-chain amino acid transport system permease protein